MRVRFQIGGLALLAAAACGEDESERAAPAAEPTRTAAAERPAAAATAPAAATPVVPQPPVWSYSSIGKRDPFRSDLAVEAASSQREVELEETERFELDQYRLTGLLTGTAQPKAMVEDPTGTGHTLRIGSRLGRNGGRVTRIGVLGRGVVGIVVTEEFRAPTGERVRVPIQIPLPKAELELTIEQ